ncbi:MAG: hypothetical protein KY443_09560 [Actinobacteria bacterium]|nr:hypothetical protein [Actinomycetota bacterium]
MGAVVMTAVVDVVDGGDVVDDVDGRGAVLDVVVDGGAVVVVGMVGMGSSAPDTWARAAPAATTAAATTGTERAKARRRTRVM